MIFTEILFIPFILFTIIVANFILIKKRNLRLVFLTIMSYIFYASWNWKFAGLILLSTLIDYYLGQKIYSADTIKKSKFYLILSLTSNLTILGFFKYFNFFIDNVNWLFGSDFIKWNILLPVGISFYTFQTMSYSIDIYRKNIQPEKDFVRFAFFVSFFPQLVAGPIVRAVEFLPQTHKKITIGKENYYSGIQIFLIGFIKKVLIADLIAIYVDRVFANPEIFSTGTIWLAVIAYAIQIFCDFSGYSDMAIGIAKMLGYDLVRNFNLPYISHNITEFWRRWHISLSRWIRDYIYIPLGGNRNGKYRQYFNLIITMLLGGLWHGASWNFVLWGGMHGIGLAGEKMIGLHRRSYNFIGKIFGWFITFIFVLISWVFFRSSDFATSFLILKKMFIISGGINWVFMPLIYIIFIVIIAHLIGIYLNKINKVYFIVDMDKTIYRILLLILIIVIYMFMSSNSVPFIYFQF